nr:MAG TPA: hypothetical protein [Caudoviricetes sp.]
MPKSSFKTKLFTMSSSMSVVYYYLITIIVYNQKNI